MSYEQKLADMGFRIEPVQLEAGKLTQAVRTGNLVYTSGQISSWDGKQLKGKVGADVTPEQAYEGAKFCALNALRAVKAVTGSLDNVTRVVKILGMVNVAPGFDDTSTVINGCTDLLRDVFGPAGHHARSAVGMTLPAGWAVEIEMVVEVK